MSFSAAIIDDDGGRSRAVLDPRRGVAHVRQGSWPVPPTPPLTPEEQQALAAARTGKRERMTDASQPTRYGYFGPAGTFTQMALKAWAPEADAGIRLGGRDAACRRP